MKRLLSGAVALAAVVLSAAPALAAHVGIDDPAGDRSGHGLDITRATLRNHQHRLVVDVAFVRSVRGDLIVSVDPRRAPGIRLISQYDPVGNARNLVLAGAFTDHGLGEESGRVPCRGYRVQWSPDQPTVRLTLPARCLADGEYDELRFAVLTERRSDTDYAPGEAPGSAWVPRG